MVELTDKDIARYFQRSYSAADGLWFMKVEERFGFEEALRADLEVWKVLPKIQARTLKALTRMEHGMDALFHCLATKLKLENYLFTVAREGDRGFKIMISRCPWRDALLKAGRESVAAEIGTSICRNEYTVWAREFDNSIRFEMNQFLCGGSGYCTLEFRKEDAVESDEDDQKRDAHE